MARFSEEEAQRIFARAAERQHASDEAPPGFSLEELQEIGRAAGLSPDHVAAAVAEVRQGVVARPDHATFFGVDVEPHAERVLPGPLTDDAWAQFVERMRRTFKTTGVTSDVGRVREWNGTNASGGLSNLRLTATPVEGGTRVTLSTSRAAEARQSWGGTGGFGIPALLILILAAAQGDLGNPGLLGMLAVLAAAALLFPVGYRVAFSRWSGRRTEQFAALLDQFDLVVRAEAGPGAERAGAAPTADAPDPAVQRPALDLDGLPDAPPSADDATRTRTRT